MGASLVEKGAYGVIAICIAIFIQLAQDLTSSVPIPKLDQHAYWGPNDVSTYVEDSSIKLFNVSYSDRTINQLKFKLEASADIQDSLEDTKFEYGFNSKEIKKIVKYWKDTYLNKWRDREEFLNKFKHYRTQIQGLKIHFIRAKPATTIGKTVYPILLLHGWPGSVREFYDIIPKLTEVSPDRDYVFEVIAPSLPGFGWSQGSSKKNFGPTEMAVVFNNLMGRLGYEKYFVQGGDWGSLIGNIIASLYPKNVTGYHSNFCISQSGLAMLKLAVSSVFPPKVIGKPYVHWYFPLRHKFKYILSESGYMHLQSTKPDTIGLALSNNPVGLAGYILEKFSTWTHPDNRNTTDGGLSKYFDRDALLDNVMIYYLTNSITTSVRIYYEEYNKHQSDYKTDRIPVIAPVACARFRHELLHMTDWSIKDKFPNIIQSTYHEEGGHFAAFERPEELAEDILEFAKKVVTKKVVTPKPTATTTKSKGKK